jgi:two-component system, sensor histidine kinase and response regulator
MGGSITLVSTPGVGSTFTFVLPLVPDANPAEDAEPSSRLHGVRTLIVDDLDVNRRLLMAQLSAWGLDCAEASDGTVALAMVAEAERDGRPYQLAILDYLMPGLDGEALGKALLSTGTPPALILLTSGGQREDARRFLDMGFAGYLVKPVARPHLLRRAILRALGEERPTTAAMLPVSAPVVTREGGTRPRVLVAEDNPVNLRLASILLSKLGFSVDAAVDGVQAVGMHAANLYDVILMDCQMPELDGFEATRRIRQAETGGRRTPIVALTANVAGDVRELCLVAGMDDYLTKPVAIGRLTEVLGRWVPCTTERRLARNTTASH